MASLTNAGIIALGGASNARNPGCGRETTEPKDLPTIAKELKIAASQGIQTAVLVGGEPTIRKDILQLLQVPSKFNQKLALVTNGRMLVYPKLREALLNNGLSYIRVGIHGADAAVHDRAVGVAGAFAQIIEGTSRLMLEGDSTLSIDLTCAVRADNLDDLTKLAEKILELPRRTLLTIRFACPVFADNWPLSERTAEQVNRALRLVVSAGSDLRGAWEGFAPCLFEEHSHLRDEYLRYEAPVFGGIENAQAILREDNNYRNKAFPCQDCVNEPTCPGAPSWMIAAEGEESLRPTRSVRANSFNYELETAIDGFIPEVSLCKGPKLLGAGEAVRSVFFLRNGAVARYACPSSDFSTAEIAQVKDALEQLYVDNNEGAALFDFQKSVRRLRFLSVCRTCEKRKLCCGTVSSEQTEPFDREERWLRKEVSRLRGRVLDVGCGDQLYRDEIRMLIEDGQVEYHGLDPDFDALSRMKDAGINAVFHHGLIEDFSFEAGYFDYVLGLRSINHFRDMQKAFSVITNVTRPQAQMVLCDSPPFGMLRTHAQVQYADSNAPLGHEHFRNWTSYQVVDFLKRFPFRIDVHRPVNAQSSNLWILKLMRLP